MSLIIPRTNPGGGRIPTLTEYVESFLSKMRAPLRERTTFTPAGRSVMHSEGERILFGPKGQKIRVVQRPDGGVQVEHGNEQGRGVEHQHAHVRPQCVTISFGDIGGDPDAVIRAQEKERARSTRRIIIPR